MYNLVALTLVCYHLKLTETSKRDGFHLNRRRETSYPNHLPTHTTHTKPCLFRCPGSDYGPWLMTQSNQPNCRMQDAMIIIIQVLLINNLSLKIPHTSIQDKRTALKTNHQLTDVHGASGDQKENVFNQTKLTVASVLPAVELLIAL